jgi:hypothetical protein
MQSRDGIYQINQLLPDIPTDRYPQSGALSREIFTAHIPPTWHLRCHPEFTACADIPRSGSHLEIA